MSSSDATTSAADAAGASQTVATATAAGRDGTLAGHDSLEKILEEHLPADKLAEVRRVLYGCNMGSPVKPLALPHAVVAAAEAGGFDLQAYRFGAAPEQLRPPRITRCEARSIERSP